MAFHFLISQTMCGPFCLELGCPSASHHVWPHYLLGLAKVAKQRPKEAFAICDATPDPKSTGTALRQISLLSFLCLELFISLGTDQS